MNQLVANRILIAMFVCFGMGYPLYCWTAQAGIYSWLVDAELALQGKGPYFVHASWLMIPTLVISWVLGLAVYLPATSMVDRMLAPAVALNEKRTVPAPAADAPAPAPAAGSLVDNPLFIYFLAGSVALIIVGVVAGVIAYRESSTAVTFEALNLAEGAPPSSKYVKLTGLAITSLKSQYSFQVRSASYVETYIPIVVPGWKPGDPVTYFLHPAHDTFGNIEPVMTAQTGVLIRDGLSGPALFLCKKHGVKLGKPAYVLESDPHAEAEPYISAALYCTIIGLAFFLPIAGSWVKTLFHH
jgi:hypothetical protein